MRPRGGHLNWKNQYEDNLRLPRKGGKVKKKTQPQAEEHAIRGKNRLGGREWGGEKS